MLATKRFDYVPFDQLHLHPSILNHRPLNQAKIDHYAEDILRNGLLEPLVVWERNPGDYYLVGGFHRWNAINKIRQTHPGYFDRIDVRVVHGELDEIQALNLKLNADRLDARISDYFDAVIFMANANWDKTRIAQFLDKSEAWIDDILRYAPRMDGRIRRLLENGTISWIKAKAVCKAVLSAEPGQERAVLEAQLAALSSPAAKPAKPISFKRATTRLSKSDKSYRVTGADLSALLEVVRGKAVTDASLARVRAAFPGLLD
jgi:ParB-like chromosome segregation protein Spo0J